MGTCATLPYHFFEYDFCTTFVLAFSSTFISQHYHNHLVFWNVCSRVACLLSLNMVNLKPVAGQKKTTSHSTRKSGLRTTNSKKTDFNAQSLGALFHESPLMMLVSDLQTGKVLAANPAFIEFSGYQLEELLGEPPPALWDTHDTYLAAARTLHSSPSSQLCIGLMTKSGSKYIATLSLSVLKLGRKKYALTTVLDVLPLAALDAAAPSLPFQPRSDAAFHSFIMRAPIGICKLSLHGTFLQTNTALQRMLGYSAEEFSQLRIQDISHPADYDLETAFLDKVFSGEKQTYSLIKRLVHKDGHNIWVSFSAIVMQDTQGQAPYMIGVVQDVTVLKQLEKSLRESRELFESVIDTAAIGICVTDEEGRYVLVNPAYCATYGYSKEELLGQHFSMVIPTEDQLKATKTHSAFIAGDPNSSGEWRLRHKDGRLIDIYVTAGLWVREDGRRFKVTTVEDITERKRTAQKLKETEATLQQSQKMEAVGILASGIAHDFNNILGGILGNIKLLYRYLPHASEQILTPIQRIELSAQRAAKLIQNLLSFVRKGKFLSVSFSVVDAINHVVQILQPSIDRRITLHTHFAPKLPNIIGDPNQIEQVFLNLLINAIDAITPKLQDGHKGNIIIMAETVSLPEEKIKALELPPHRSYLHLSFSDNGTGIPEDVQSRIFDPFFTTKAVGKGTGLGLSMVIGAVKSHHGAVTFETTLGKGTTFHLYFPPAVTAERQVLTSSMTTIFRKVMQKRHTILIIEDEDILRQMLYDVFSEANFHVLCAVDGEDGLAQFQAHYPNIDFVVLDMNMPNLNGEHVCKVLSEQYSKLPPIIVTTGYVADDVVQRLYLYGIHDFVMKPYDVDMLLQQVCEILEPPSTRS
jgi:two-component system cell cycle sensor histidine kinase/response regulator CckA